MRFLFVLAALSAIGADEEQVELWSGSFGDVNLTLFARQSPEVIFKPPAGSDLPVGSKPGLAALWLEAQVPEKGKSKCIWTRLSKDARLEVVVHLRQDGMLGIAYLNSPSTALSNNHVVFSEVDLTLTLPEPSTESPFSSDAPSRRAWGSTNLKSFHPLHLLSSQLPTVVHEDRAYRPTLQQLSFSDDMWKVTMCLRGTSFEFKREVNGWVVTKSDSDLCRKVPPLRGPETHGLRLPNPDNRPDDNRFGAEGFGGGSFGSGLGTPKKASPKEDSGNKRE